MAYLKWVEVNQYPNQRLKTISECYQKSVSFRTVTVVPEILGLDLLVLFFP